MAYVKQVFKRTDKDTEIYNAITDSVYDFRRRLKVDEAEVETEVTTNISVLGNFKIALETNLGLLNGNIVLLDGTNSHTLRKVTKAQYDELYPNQSASGVSKSRPVHFCVYAGYFWIGPVPDSISYDYKLNYTKRGGSISSGTSEVPFTNLYRDILRDAVLFRVFAGLEHDDQAQKYKALYENALKEIEAREERNREAVENVCYQGI